MSGSRCRHQERRENAQQLNKISPELASKEEESNNDSAKSIADSIRDVSKNVSTKTDGRDHVNPSVWSVLGAINLFRLLTLTIAKKRL